MGLSLNGASKGMRLWREVYFPVHIPHLDMVLFPSAGQAHGEIFFPPRGIVSGQLFSTLQAMEGNSDLNIAGVFVGL